MNLNLSDISGSMKYAKAHLAVIHLHQIQQSIGSHVSRRYIERFHEHI